MWRDIFTNMNGLKHYVVWFVHQSQPWPYRGAVVEDSPVDLHHTNWSWNVQWKLMKDSVHERSTVSLSLFTSTLRLVRDRVGLSECNWGNTCGILDHMWLDIGSNTGLRGGRQWAPRLQSRGAHRYRRVICYQRTWGCAAPPAACCRSSVSARVMAPTQWMRDSHLYAAPRPTDNTFANILSDSNLLSNKWSQQILYIEAFLRDHTIYWWKLHRHPSGISLNFVEYIKTTRFTFHQSKGGDTVTERDTKWIENYFFYIQN